MRYVTRKLELVSNILWPIVVTEPFKFVNDLSTKLVVDCFKLNNITEYNTRDRSTPYSQPVYTVIHGTESLSHLGLEIWELVPSDMKNLSTLTTFKKAIKQWKPNACPCRLCRTYIYQVGFVYPLNTKSTFSARVSCFICKCMCRCVGMWVCM